MRQLSTRTLERRYERVLDLQRSDPLRFLPNPLGPGYLTRQERYSEIIWTLERELRRRYCLPPC